LGGIQRDAADRHLQLIEQLLHVLFAAEPALGKSPADRTALFVIELEVIAELGFAAELNGTKPRGQST
jgi:hypothetical protein